MTRNSFDNHKNAQAKRTETRQFDRNIRSWERAKTPKENKR
jgi:hypothetical protein